MNFMLSVHSYNGTELLLGYDPGKLDRTKVFGYNGCNYDDCRCTVVIWLPVPWSCMKLKDMIWEVKLCSAGSLETSLSNDSIQRGSGVTFPMCIRQRRSRFTNALNL